MIIIDLMEYVGKSVKIYFEDGDIREGTLEYVPTFSAIYGYRKAKHFYIGTLGFRAHHVKKVMVKK